MNKSHLHNLDEYAYISRLRTWNSVWKAVFSMGAVSIVLLADSMRVSFMTVCYMCSLSVGVGKVQFRDYIRLLRIPLAFLLLSGIAITLQIGGNTADSVTLPGNVTLCIPFFGTDLCFTKQGLHMAANIMLKAFGAVSAMYVVTLSTPMGEILSVLGKMHVPSLIIELMYLIYRYIFLLADRNRKQKDAAMSRLGYHSYKASIRSFSNGLANLLVLSLKKGSECYDAMESRGYDGTLQMWEEECPVTKKQIGWMIGYLVLVGMILL